MASIAKFNDEVGLNRWAQYRTRLPLCIRLPAELSDRETATGDRNMVREYTLPSSSRNKTRAGQGELAE